MNENHRSEDTAGHRWDGAANPQAGEDDAEGHAHRLDQQAGEDDAAGHRSFVDPQAGEDDVAGHRSFVDQQAGEEDAAGHVHSGAIRPDIYGDAGRTP